MLGKDYYRAIYQAQLCQEAEWARRTAIGKAESVERLLRRISLTPSAVLELGCGTGALLQECRRRGLGRVFVGVDYSEEAIEYLRQHLPGIRGIVADIADPGFSLTDSFELVIMSHVLEHMERPCQCLREVQNKLRFRYLIAEVPLDGLFASRVKNVLRGRRMNKAGHVQSFTVRTFEELLEESGLRILGIRLYAPVLDFGTARFVGKKDQINRLCRIVKIATSCLLPRMLQPLWKRLYYAHCAVLCERQS